MQLTFLTRGYVLGGELTLAVTTASDNGSNFRWFCQNNIWNHKSDLFQNSQKWMYMGELISIFNEWLNDHVLEYIEEQNSPNSLIIDTSHYQSSLSGSY